MPHIIQLQQADDPRLVRFANLRSDADRPYDCDSFIVEGRWCLQRLAASRFPIMSVLVQRGKEDEVAQWLPDSVPIYSLPVDEIKRLVGYNFHRGMLACGRRPVLRRPGEIEFRVGRPRLALAAIGINQEENLGSMMRTAAALGIEHFLLGPKTADPYSRRTIRVSMAAVFKLQLLDLDQPARQLRELADSFDVRTIVTTLDSDAIPLDEFVVDDRAGILIVGNEAEGVDRSIQDVSTDRVTIPMQLGTDSLNVAVAAAIFMYQLGLGFQR